MATISSHEPVFTIDRPTEAGKYLWRLPEPDGSGFYVVDVEIVVRDGALLIYDEVAGGICSVDWAGLNTSWAKVPTALHVVEKESCSVVVDSSIFSELPAESVA